MIDLKYSLVIEATDDPNFFGSYSPDLEVFPVSAIPSKIAFTKPVGEWMSILPFWASRECRFPYR